MSFDEKKVLVQTEPINYKFDALKYRHENQVQEMRLLIQYANKLFYSFFGLQVALSSFISQATIKNVWVGILLLLIDLICASLVLWLLSTNHDKRKKIRENINKCNSALGYNTPGVYAIEELESTPPKASEDKGEATFLKNKDGSYKWFPQYLWGILFSVLAVSGLLFNSYQTNRATGENNPVIVIQNGDTTIIKHDTLVIYSNSAIKRQEDEKLNQ